MWVSAGHRTSVPLPERNSSAKFGHVTASHGTALPDIGPAHASRLDVSSALQLRRLAGLLLVTLVIALLELSGRPPGLDPVVLIPMAVLAGAALDGLVGGAIGGVVGSLYIVIYYSDPTLGAAAAGARVLTGLAATALSVLVAVALRDRASAAQRRAERRAADSDAVTALAARLGAEPAQAVAETLVRGAVDVVDVDMAVLTVLDPQTGQHIVRAAYGGSTSAVGVAVMPGAGITGRAITDRRLVVSAGRVNQADAVAGLRRRLQGRATAHSMAAVPCLQSGRVIATLTVGRADGWPFGNADKRVLKALGPLLILATTQPTVD